jgi:hypothetical protein
MANEISTTANFTATKGGATINVSASKAITMSGVDMVQATQNIGTSAEALSFGDITGVPAFCIVKNLDATNFIELATDSGMSNKFAKILAGQWAAFPPSAAAIYALANTAGVLVQVGAAEA